MSSSTVAEELRTKVGSVVHLSDWLQIDQPRIDAFAAATGDRQWIHVDPERAAAESQYGCTIAHGYLTLSLYPLLRQMVDESRPIFPGLKNVINYGLDKVRFPNAVRCGARVRGRSELLAVEEVRGAVQATERFTMEVEGEERPACVAEAIMRYYF